MLRKRLNLKEKLGSIVKRGESHGTDNDCYDITDVESAEELKLKCEANAKENEASPWSYEERKAFEEQLEQLGDQLGDSLIKNAELEEELKSLQSRDLVKQYKEEKKSNKLLQKRVSELERMLATMREQTVDRDPLDSWETVDRDDFMNEEVSQIEARLQRAEDLGSSDGSEEQVMEPSQSQSETETALGWRGRVTSWILDKMIDFTDEQPEPDSLVMSNFPLTYKRLKKSLKRFGKHLKLLLRSATWLKSVISWNNPFLTFTVFVVYMYAAWLDLLIPLLLLLCIGKLIVNYFYATGIASQFGFTMDQPIEETITENKMHLILDVARHVQNKLAFASDNAEKIKNLFLWHEPKATKKLMMILMWAFLLTTFLPGRLVFKCIVMAVGVKIFIVRPIYIAFPRVEKRYGSISRLYKGLPTDEQLKNYYELSETERDIRRRRVVVATPEHARRESAQPTLTPADYEFCQRFVIDPPEARIKPLDDGVACQLIDRSLSVLHMLKSGKLYLTTSFLVFERLFRKNKGSLRQDDYILIPLQDVVSVRKFKPFGFLPGKGLSIEITVTEQEKPYVFGALLSRDEVYRTILETGASAGLRWNNMEEDQSGN